jgi:hypothetical protein
MQATASCLLPRRRCPGTAPCGLRPRQRRHRRAGRPCPQPPRRALCAAPAAAAAMASCTLYLEQYVESTTTLPAELQRILNTIKFLDEKSNALRDAVAAQTDTLMAMPMPAQRTPEQDAVGWRGAGVGGRGLGGLRAGACGATAAAGWSARQRLHVPAGPQPSNEQAGAFAGHAQLGIGPSAGAHLEALASHVRRRRARRCCCSCCHVLARPHNALPAAPAIAIATNPGLSRAAAADERDAAAAAAVCRGEGAAGAASQRPANNAQRGTGAGGCSEG